MQTLNSWTIHDGHDVIRELTFYDADLVWFIFKSPDLVEGSKTPRQWTADVTNLKTGLRMVLP